METISYILEWIEAHPALMQILGILTGAIIALFAAKKAYEGVLEQIRTTFLIDQHSKDVERIAIYSAFAADLDALDKSLTGIHEALNSNDVNEGRLITKSVILATRNVVWESCAPKIGTIDPNHAANIIETYRFIEAITGRVKELDLGEATHRKDLSDLIEGAIEQIRIVNKQLPIRPDREKIN
ncbi:MAG: hypothetical protein OQJ97_11580 [Rhodospirillales bacterium]|nr:hypothetical protein [Rhodospirillales bacterium]